jgi:beta-glucanase (GH16 family)
MTKWWFAPWAKHPEKKVALDGEGHLTIKCDFIPGTTNLTAGGIWSAQGFRYGFFEAKVKFTKNSGWWAAFWLYGRSNTNPGVDGSEIDIFEDYYTRSATPAGPHRPILDHNLHVSVGRALQSWNYKSELPGTLDDWYVIGCKWTPFEISYYVNGQLMSSKANHSSYDSVTFDAKNHAALNAPLHILFSGCIMHGWGRRDTRGFTFPEYFKIDHVRVWEYPKDDPALPKVAWRGAAAGERVIVKEGEKVAFEAEIEPSAATKSPIKEAYLFDCGHPVATRTAPPWRFEIPLTEEYYRTTRYMAPGRSGKSPPWDRITHCFRVYVRDEAGKIASTDEVRYRIPAAGAGAAGTPWKGKAHAVPGTILPWQFDEGGREVGHHSLTAAPRTKGRLLRKDTAFDCRKATVMQLKTGEWMNYTVNVATGGTYRATLSFGTGNKFPNKVLLIVDGMNCGEFDCPWPGKWNWAARKAPPIEGLKLDAGQHTITLAPIGYLSVGTLTIDPM